MQIRREIWVFNLQSGSAFLQARRRCKRASGQFRGNRADCRDRDQGRQENHCTCSGVLKIIMLFVIFMLQIKIFSITMKICNAALMFSHYAMCCIIFSNNFQSFMSTKCKIQCRGSIPLFWSQKPNLRWQPIPMMRPTDDQLLAFKRPLRAAKGLLWRETC